MIDAALIEKKLAFIETGIRELNQQARPELLASDVREARFVQHTLQLAIQAALDVASQIVSQRHPRESVGGLVSLRGGSTSRRALMKPS